MKIIYVAQLAPDHDRDDLWLHAFKRLGLNIIPFSTFKYENASQGVRARLEMRMHVGRRFNQMRKDLLCLVQQEKPEWVHFRLPLHFDSKILNQLKKKDVILTSYYNDDPFSAKRVLGLHSLFIKCIPLYDAHFVFRKKNVEEFKRRGAICVVHCAPFFDPDYHQRASVNQAIKYENDAVFIGHWENDGRLQYIESLVSAGYAVTVRGPLWDKATTGTILNRLEPFTPVFGEEYSRLYRNARAGLCFFSSINNDSWTRRPLEIVGSGGLLVCQRTEEAVSNFKDGEEAFFFSSVNELLLIMKYIYKHPAKAELVRARGYKRLCAGKHTIVDRIETMLDVVTEIRNR